MTDGDVLDASPTRSDLLEVQQRAAMAHKGHSLLKRKQDALIGEFLSLVHEHARYRDETVALMRSAYKALALDTAYSGLFVSRSVAYGTRELFDITYTRRNVMGLRLPALQATRKEVPANTYENAPQLVEATRLFHRLFERLVKLAGMELSLQALAEEIKRLRRRTNSLEHIQIPKAERTVSSIRFVLEEQERESFARLKVIKRRLDKDE